MTLAAKSWALRESARLAIEDGEFGQAAEYASESQRLHRTLRGESLMALSEYLKVPPEASATSAALTESEPIPARRTAPYLEVHLL